MKMLMLFDAKEKAEKNDYKFGYEEAQTCNKWMPCSMHIPIN